MAGPDARLASIVLVGSLARCRSASSWARKRGPVPFLLVHEEQLSPPDNVVTGLLATLNDVIAVRESIAAGIGAAGLRQQARRMP
jgi:hypothetical protein